MKVIFKKEISALLTSFRTYLFWALMLAACSACAFFVNIRSRNPLFQENGNYLALALAAFVPLLTAPTFAADRKNRTERLLFMLPIKPGAMVMGRFLACLIPVGIACGLTLLYPAALGFIGGEGMLACVGLAAALFCLGALLVALTLLISCLTAAPWQAYLASVAVCAVSYFLPLATGNLIAASALSTTAMLALMALVFLVIYLVSGSVFAGVVGTAIVDVPIVISRMQDGGAKAAHTAGSILNRLALFEPMQSYALGIVRVGDMVFYLSAAALLLVVTALCLRAKRQGARRALA